MANDFGITPEGFNTKRLPDILSDLEDRIKLALNNETALLPDSPEGQLSGLFAILYTELWEQLNGAYSAFNPQSVIEQTLDNLVSLNGITRMVAQPSTAVLTVVGIENTVIPANSIVSNQVTSAQFLTDVDVTIPGSGTITINAHSKIFDVIVANAGDLNVIETPVNGWTSATNIAAAIVGRLLESDAELRVRRSRSLSLSGQSSLGSIFAAVSAVSGVAYVSINENVTDVIQPLTLLPPHSFSVVVRGGANQDIGDAIWNKKPVGILSFGDIDVTVKDIQGDDHVISFQRAVSQDIWVRGNITFFSGLVPDDAATIMAQAIIDYAEGKLVTGAGFEVGDDIIHSRIYTPINLTFQGHTINSLDIGIGSPSTVVLDVTGTNGTLIPLGSVVSNVNTSSRWVTVADVTIGAGGTGQVNALVEDFGLITAAIGELTVIETPITGWASVNNAVAAITYNDWTTADIVIQFNQVGVFALARIDLTVG